MSKLASLDKTVVWKSHDVLKTHEKPEVAVASVSSDHKAIIIFFFKLIKKVVLQARTATQHVTSKFHRWDLLYCVNMMFLT